MNARNPDTQNPVLQTLDTLSHPMANPDPTQAGPALRGVIDTLERARRQDPAAWRSLIPAVRRHAVRGLAHRDPFIERAFTQPRGYPGDAALLDHIYNTGAARTQSARLRGTPRTLNRLHRVSMACQGVRNRRTLLAEQIQQCLAVTPNARVLSLAAGHLREAELVDWDLAHSPELLLAGDQDPLSVKEIEDSAYHPCVQARLLSVRDVLTGRLEEKDFDLCYAAGLYDYLNDSVATALTRRFYEATRPGGVVLLANFADDCSEVGYMEAIMNWFLIYRSTEDLERIARNAAPDAELRSFPDPSGQIVYTELRRPR